MATKKSAKKCTRMLEPLEGRLMLSSTPVVADSSLAPVEGNVAPAEICQNGDVAVAAQNDGAAGENQNVAGLPAGGEFANQVDFFAADRGGVSAHIADGGIAPFGFNGWLVQWQTGIASTHRAPTVRGLESGRWQLPGLLGIGAGSHRNHALFDDDDDDPPWRQPAIKGPILGNEALPPPPIGVGLPCVEGIGSVNRSPVNPASASVGPSPESSSKREKNKEAVELNQSDEGGGVAPALAVVGVPDVSGAVTISNTPTHIAPPDSSASWVSPSISRFLRNGIILASIDFASVVFASEDSKRAVESPHAGDIAAAEAEVKLIGENISADLAAARQLFNSGMGPSSIVASANFVKKLLLSNASALAAVANAAASSVDAEIRVLRKEFAVIAGIGVLVGVYAVKSREHRDGSVAGKKRRRSLLRRGGESPLFYG